MPFVQTSGRTHVMVDRIPRSKLSECLLIVLHTFPSLLYGRLCAVRRRMVSLIRRCYRSLGLSLRGFISFKEVLECLKGLTALQQQHRPPNGRLRPQEGLRGQRLAGVNRLPWSIEQKGNLVTSALQVCVI